MNLIRYMLQDLYEHLIKKEADIVADTIELAMKERLYDPDANPPMHFKPAFACIAVTQLYHKKRITLYANKMTREFIMNCLHPYDCFESYVGGNPEKYPGLTQWQLRGADEMQRARIRWLNSLVKLLRSPL